MPYDGSMMYDIKLSVSLRYLCIHLLAVLEYHPAPVPLEENTPIAFCTNPINHNKKNDRTYPPSHDTTCYARRNTG